MRFCAPIFAFPATFEFLHFLENFILGHVVFAEVERWSYTPMSVGSNPSAEVVCLPQPAENYKEVLICHEKRVVVRSPQ